MPAADLFSGVKSRAGLIGLNHNVVITDIAVVEHALESKGDDRKTVVQRYPTTCFTKISMFVEDPDVDPQYRQGEFFLQVGRLPLWRTQQLGEQPDKNQITYPGGFIPSLDAGGEQPATAGPFVRIEGEEGIWEGAEHHMFFKELAGLASSAGQLDRLKAEVAAKGVAAIKGLRFRCGEKAKPKGSRKAAAPKPGQPAAEEQTRTVRVPDKINQWPWEAAVPNATPPALAPPTPTPQVAALHATPPAAAPLVAAPASPAPSPTAIPVQQVVAGPTPAATTTGTANHDQLTVDRVRRVVKASGGSLPVTELVAKVFADTSDMGNGADRTAVMQRVYDANWIAAQAGLGAFLSDGTTIMYAGA